MRKLFIIEAMPPNVFIDAEVDALDFRPFDDGAHSEVLTVTGRENPRPPGSMSMKLSINAEASSPTSSSSLAMEAFLTISALRKSFALNASKSSRHSFEKLAGSAPSATCERNSCRMGVRSKATELPAPAASDTSSCGLLVSSTSRIAIPT
nr:hypothetical 15.9K protein - Thiobacillus ferrooxidans [Acidithiobacillus ferrooxidans]